MFYIKKALVIPLNPMIIFEVPKGLEPWDDYWLTEIAGEALRICSTYKLSELNTVEDWIVRYRNHIRAHGRVQRDLYYTYEDNGDYIIFNKAPSRDVSGLTFPIKDVKIVGTSDQIPNRSALKRFAKSQR